MHSRASPWTHGQERVSTTCITRPIVASQYDEPVQCWCRERREQCVPFYGLFLCNCSASLRCCRLGPVEEVQSVEDRTFRGPQGDIPVRIYKPAAKPGLQFSALVYIHGAGRQLRMHGQRRAICLAFALVQCPS